MNTCLGNLAECCRVKRFSWIRTGTVGVSESEVAYHNVLLDPCAMRVIEQMSLSQDGNESRKGESSRSTSERWESKNDSKRSLYSITIRGWDVQQAF